MQVMYLKAATDGKTALVKRCVTEHSVSLETVDGAFEDTGLHLATRANQLETVRCFVSELGQPVDSRNNRGDTPLHRASQEGLADMARCLIVELGASVNTVTEAGETPLHLAALHGKCEVVEILVEVRGERKGRCV